MNHVLKRLFSLNLAVAITISLSIGAFAVSETDAVEKTAALAAEHASQTTKQSEEYETIPESKVCDLSANQYVKFVPEHSGSYTFDARYVRNIQIFNSDWTEIAVDYNVEVENGKVYYIKSTKDSSFIIYPEQIDLVPGITISAWNDADSSAALSISKEWCDKNQAQQILIMMYRPNGQMLYYEMQTYGKENVEFALNISENESPILKVCATNEKYEAVCEAITCDLSTVLKPVDEYDFTLTNGQLVGEPWKVPYAVNEECTIPDQYTIYGLTAQKLDNDCVRVTLEYQAPAGMNVKAFNYPDGRKIDLLRKDQVSGNREKFVFDLMNKDIFESGRMCVGFYGGGKELDERQYIIFSSTDINKSTPIGEPWEVPYAVNQACTIADQYTIYGLTAQKLDNGYIRVTLEYQAPAGMMLDAFSPPNGDIFKIFRNEKTSGKRETFIYDLPIENLKQINFVTMKFFSEDKEENECQYVSAYATDIIGGNLVGNPWDVSYTLNQECTISDQYTIYGLSAQKIENGNIRMTLVYQAPAGMGVNAFNPPNGNVFAIYRDKKTSGSRETFFYNLRIDDLKRIDYLVMNFYGGGKEGNECQYVSVLASEILRGIA